MSTNLTLHTTAAEALTGLLPADSPLKAVIHPAPDLLRSGRATAVSAVFVGAVSADVAVFLDGIEATAATASADNTAVSATDILRPALEAATGKLGSGVLGEAVLEDVAALLSDTDTALFALLDGANTVGWFAIRIRENAPARGQDPNIAAKLGRINDVQMALAVEIGKTRMSVRDFLALEPGAVIELDRSAGAHADVLLNDRLVAHGEVVVVDQDYAVRITKMLDTAEARS